MAQRIGAPVTAYFHTNDGILRVTGVEIVEGVGVGSIEEINSGSGDDSIDSLTRVTSSFEPLTVVTKAVKSGVSGEKVLRLRGRRNRCMLIYRIGKYCLNRTFTNTSETSFRFSSGLD